MGNTECRSSSRNSTTHPTTHIVVPTESGDLPHIERGLGDTTRRYSDETAVGPAATSVIEARSKNPSVVAVNLRGYDTVRRDIIKQRISSSQKPLIEWMWSPFVGAYIPPVELQIHSFDELQESKQLFLNTIRTMQAWNQEIDDSDESEWSDQQEPRGYKTLLRETVQSERVRNFFEVSPDYINSVQQRDQFVLLFALNLFLYKHRGDLSRVTRILHSLKTAIDGRGSLEPVTGNPPSKSQL